MSEYAQYEAFANPQSISYVFDLDYTLYSRDDFTNHPNIKIMYDSFQPKPFLHQLLKSLKGNKYIFTNANYKHTHEVLKRCGIPENIFLGITSYDMSKFLKPAPESYLYAIQKFNLTPEDITIFFEDTLENLKAAKELHGWLTVWITPYARGGKPDYVDYSFSSIEEALLFFVIRDKVNRDTIV